MFNKLQGIYNKSRTQFHSLNGPDTGALFQINKANNAKAQRQEYQRKLMRENDKLISRIQSKKSSLG